MKLQFEWKCSLVKECLKLKYHFSGKNALVHMNRGLTEKGHIKFYEKKKKRMKDSSVR